MDTNSGTQNNTGITRTVSWNLFLILSGSAICAIAINGILIPKQLLSSGITGLALLVHYVFPGIHAGAAYFVLNIPLYVIGWIYIGRRFFFYSIAGMAIFSAVLFFVKIPVPISDPLLSVLLAGIVAGLGSGIILKSFGSAGGTDILAIILLKQFSIRIGTTILIFNSVLLVATAFIFSIEVALYALIFLFVNARMVNLVVTGLSQRKAVTIISPFWKNISIELIDTFQRGVTHIQGEGGYSGTKEYILYTIIAFQELPRLKRIIRRIDPEAFVVVTDTIEVMNQRIGNQPHW